MFVSFCPGTCPTNTQADGSNRKLKKSASGVLASLRSSTGTRPPHHSAARTDLVLLIRRTVRPRGYASGFLSPAALPENHFEQPYRYISEPVFLNSSAFSFMPI